MLLGCISDDFTGGSDIANTLAHGGMRTVLYSGVPASVAPADVEAGVVALKTRTIAADEAVRQSLAAVDWLLAQGCSQIVFKVCSTFDSTPKGNIGPVAAALAEHLKAGKVIVCPAFPATKRTVYQGHLFIGDRLLSETGMRHHPLTPMNDADLRRWLQRQTTIPVGHLDHATVRAGAPAIRDRIAGNALQLVIVDALSDEDLIEIGTAASGLPLLVGGSGIAIGLPRNFGCTTRGADDWFRFDGPGLVIAGSCSEATRAQIRAYSTNHPSLRIDPDEVIDGTMDPEKTLRWVMQQESDAPLVYASASPQAVLSAQAKHGREQLALALDRFFGTLATASVAAGVKRLVVAGGETSGAVTQALGISALRIGPEIAPGVPATCPTDGNIGLVLKSGNFGDESFFATALSRLGAAS